MMLYYALIIIGVFITGCIAGFYYHKFSLNNKKINAKLLEKKNKYTELIKIARDGVGHFDMIARTEGGSYYFKFNGHEYKVDSDTYNEICHIWETQRIEKAKDVLLDKQIEEANKPFQAKKVLKEAQL